MKRIVLILGLVLVAVSVYAQAPSRDRFYRGNVRATAWTVFGFGTINNNYGFIMNEGTAAKDSLFIGFGNSVQKDTAAGRRIVLKFGEIFLLEGRRADTIWIRAANIADSVAVRVLISR